MPEGKIGRWREKTERRKDVMLAALQLWVGFICPHRDSQSVNGDVYISNTRWRDTLTERLEGLEGRQESRAAVF